MKFNFIYFLLVFASCVPVQTNTTTSSSNYSNFSTLDKINNNKIKTVQLYPLGNNVEDQTRDAIIQLNNGQLKLEFDDLTENAEAYTVKIYNCDAFWQLSKLTSLEYLSEYNEFDVLDYQYSIDTDHPYVHYQFNVPQVKVSGNYVLKVYKNGTENNIEFVKRFIVYENKIEIIPLASINSLGNLSHKNQMTEFFIHYDNYTLQNPRESLIVQMRQNGRWDNQMLRLQPAYVREDQRELEYRFIYNSEQFLAGNEYRFFDFRSIKYPGYRIQRMKRENNEYYAEIEKDKLRSDLAYSQYVDKNGKFYIYNQDFNNTNTASNYANVKFSLSSKKIPLDANVYLFGALTNYELIPKNKLVYDNDSNQFELEILLKQGHYDYQYYYQNDSITSNYIAGDYFETENQYEILVYYRPFGTRSDLLIGYKAL